MMRYVCGLSVLVCPGYRSFWWVSSHASHAPLRAWHYLHWQYLHCTLALSLALLRLQCGIPYEDWSLSDLKQFYPFLDAGLYGPPKRLDDEKFAVAQPGQDGAPPPQLQGAYFFPLSGYVSDPQLATLNLQYAAECEAGGTLASTLTHAHVQRVMFNNGRVAGLEATTPDGTVQVHAPVVVNAAGPHSSLVNNSVFSDPAAPAANDMKLATKPFRVEVAYLPSPPGFDFSADGTLVMDSDVGTYSRPEVGGKILVGSLEPTCDEEFDVWPETPEQCDYALTDVWTHQVYRFLQRFPTVPLPGSSLRLVDGVAFVVVFACCHLGGMPRH